jgi:sialic acid synthase SpsE
MWVYRSVRGSEFSTNQPYNTLDLLCVSKYPADIRDYQYEMKAMPYHPPQIAISDHTPGWAMFNQVGKLAVVWEKHYKLPESTGLDAGPWATTPEELAWVL